MLVDVPDDVVSRGGLRDLSEVSAVIPGPHFARSAVDMGACGVMVDAGVEVRRIGVVSDDVSSVGRSTFPKEFKVIKFKSNDHDKTEYVKINIY